MAYRPQILAARLSMLLALAAPVPALAQEVPAAPVAPATQGDGDLAKGLALQKQAMDIRQQAETRLAEEEAVCADKILVNDCRAAARQRYLVDVRQARALEAEGRGLERRAKLEEQQAKKAAQAEKRARRNAELPRRQAEQERERQAKEVARQQKLTERAARQAPENAGTPAPEAKPQ